MFLCRAIVCSVVTDCINNVVMLNILAVILSLSLSNKIAITLTLRCNPFQLKSRRNASAAGAPPQTSLGELAVLPMPLGGFRFGEGRQGKGQRREDGRGE